MLNHEQYGEDNGFFKKMQRLFNLSFEVSFNHLYLSGHVNYNFSPIHAIFVIIFFYFRYTKLSYTKSNSSSRLDEQYILISEHIEFSYGIHSYQELNQYQILERLIFAQNIFSLVKACWKKQYVLQLSRTNPLGFKLKNITNSNVYRFLIIFNNF